MKTRLQTAAFGLAALLLSRIGSAAEPPNQDSGAYCTGELTRTMVASCAVSSSAALREQLALWRAAEARREAALQILPSNPVLSGNLASRTGATERAVNWNASIGQEIEVAGQRGLRVDVADSELQVQRLRLAALRATVASDAWLEYFSVLAAVERLKLAQKLETYTQGVTATVIAMAEKGLVSDVDADIAEAAALRTTQERLRAEEQLTTARARLALLVGNTVQLSLSADLQPLKSATAALGSAHHERPEVLASRESGMELDRRADLLRRARAPNPTVSLFAQNDGFNERVYGVGLSIPIPLPQPLGRTFAGEIAETVALAERSEAETERISREQQTALTVAAAQYDSSLKVTRLYGRERIARTTTRLESIAEQVKAARLPVRDALVAQQALVEQLKAEIDAREALCAASVRLTLAAGLSLEGDAL